jgi:hypothetical protein
MSLNPDLRLAIGALVTIIPRLLVVDDGSAIVRTVECSVCLGVVIQSSGTPSWSDVPNDAYLWEDHHHRVGTIYRLDEGTTWIRGHYAPDAPEVQALLAANALVGES